MRLIHRFANLLSSLLRGRKLDAALDAELQDHIERQKELNIAAGMPAAEARLTAMREFGNLTQLGEDCREARGLRPLETLVQDLRHAVRLLGKNRGFSAAAIATIALGIASTTSIFSVVYAVILRPLPYADPQRLVSLWMQSKDPATRGSVAMADYRDWRAQNSLFEDIAIVRDIGNFNLTGSGEPERLSGARVSASLLPVLGVQPILGRGFEPGDNPIGRDGVVLLSYRLWERRFASDPAVLGRTILLNDEPHIVVGVMGPDFRYPTRDFELWKPLTFNPVELIDRLPHSYLAVARVKQGISVRQAQTEMDVIAKRINPRKRVLVAPLQEDTARPVETSLYVLLAAVTGLLLIACANLSGLLLARALSRSKELSVRMALGASRTRLIVQSLSELVPVLVLGGLLGVAATFWILRLLIPSLPPNMPRIDEIGLNGFVLSFAAAVLLFTAFSAGAWPAIYFSRRSILDSLHGSARGSSAGSRPVRSRRMLVSAQVAIAAVLLTGSCLLIRSFASIRAVDPGFRTNRVLSLHIAIPRAKYGDDNGIAAFCRRLLGQILTQSDTESAGMINRLPLGGGVQSGPLEFTGSAASPESLRDFDWRTITPGYFRTMSIPLLSGRDFTDLDTDQAMPVGIIDESTARLVWPGQNPVGRKFRIPYPGLPEVTVIGVVGHIRHNNLAREGRPQVYWNYLQRAQDRMVIVVKTRQDAKLAAAGIIRAIRTVDREQAVYDVRPMDEVMGRSLSGMWLNTVLLSAFALLALLLSSIGIYGVISYTTGQRALEFGIRMALGARRFDITAIVLQQGLTLVGGGICAGLVLAFVLSRYLEALLYQVKANDSVSIVAALATLLLVALAACLVPARRAAATDPARALRSE